MNVLSKNKLKTIRGGGNSQQQNTVGAVSSAVAGAGLGSAICGPACGVVGAHYGPIIWTAVTGFTGGFNK